VLARVEGGETVEITSRGKPIARLIPIVEGELADLVAEGWVTPALVHGPVPMPQHVFEDNAASAALTAQRDEERW
jgi:antitoxin (DNA-binding transcriptional repressor) of toxin-antitoxin stability system